MKVCLLDRRFVTRCLCTLAGALAFLTLSPWSAQANDLINANLDLTEAGPQSNPTPISWQVQSFKAAAGDFSDGCDSEPWCNVEDTGGFGVFFKPFQGGIGDEITVLLYQDLPAVAGTQYTLSVYAAAEANFCAFAKTNSPTPQVFLALEFLDASGAIVASNSVDLVVAGLPNNGAGGMIQFTTPQVAAPTKTATVRSGVYMVNAYSTSGQQSFFADAFDLESVAPAGAPVITTQPVPTTVTLGGTTTLSVETSSPGVTYQWQRNAVDLVEGGHVAGVINKTLTITNASADDAGRYRVRVTNGSGSTVSTEVPVAVNDISFFPVITVMGKIGDTYRVDYATKLDPSTWIPLSTNKLTAVPHMIIDTSSPLSNQRFYRTIFVQ